MTNDLVVFIRGYSSRWNRSSFWMDLTSWTTDLRVPWVWKTSKPDSYEHIGAFLAWLTCRLSLYSHFCCVITLNRSLSSHRRAGAEMTETPTEFQTKITQNIYIWHWVIVLSRVEPHFTPSHLPSVGCFRISCWDLAPAWLALMCTKKGWWIEPSSQLESVIADGSFFWRMDGVYVQCQWIFMHWKAHLWWEAPVGMRTRIRLTANIREVLGGIGV